MGLSMKGLPGRLVCVDDSISANICSTASWSWEYDQMMLAFCDDISYCILGGEGR